MVGRLGLTLVCAGVLAGTAAAGGHQGDPQKRHNPADQAWAQAIRIQRTDLGAGDWRVEPPTGGSGVPRGCKDPNLSDLVETGEAEDPDFSRKGSFVGSGARRRILFNGPAATKKLAPRFTSSEIRLSLAGPAAKIDGRISYYLYGRGRATAVLMIASFGRPMQPISASLERKLAELVGQRLHR